MEQFLYLPSLGFCLALAGVLAKLCAAERPRTKQAAVAIMVIISGLYLTLTLARNPVWKNNLTLFSDAVQNAPRKSRAQGSLGQTLSEIGKLPAAVRAYRMALQSEPDSASAHYNLANSYFNLKQLPLAIAEYREAVRYDPKHIKARNNLGYALEKSGDLQAAAEAYKGALSLNAGFYPSLAGLFRVDMSLGRCDEAWNLRNRLGAEAPGDLVKQLPQVCPR